MQKIMAGAARFTAVFFAISFVLTATAAILVTNIKPHLLNAATYKNALAAQQVYSRLPQIITEQVLASINYDPCQADPLLCAGATPGFINCAKAALGEEHYKVLSSSAVRLAEVDKQRLQTCLDQYGSNLLSPPGGQNAVGGMAPFLQTLGATNLDALVTQLIPPDEMQAMTDDALSQVFAYLNGQKDTVTISLVLLKQHISSPAGMDILVGIILAQPPCTLQQVDQMATSLLDSQPEILLCSPSVPVLELIRGVIQDELGVFASQIPDQVVILSPTTGENPGQPGSGLAGTIQLVQIIIRLAPIVPLFFLFFITLLVIRSIKSWLRWWGIPFLITGLLGFGLAVSSSILFEQAWFNLLVIHLPPILSDDIVTLAHDLVHAILQPYLGGVYLSAALVGLPGLGMLIVSILVRHKKEPVSVQAPSSLIS